MKPSEIVFNDKISNRDKFGIYVSEKRKSLGISLRDFAAMLDFSPAYISDIERGNRKAPLSEDVQAKMVQILKVEEDEIDFFIDLVGCSHENWPELNSAMKESKEMRMALRAARDAGLSDEEFVEAFLTMITDEKAKKEMTETFNKYLNVSGSTQAQIEPAQRQ